MSVKEYIMKLIEVNKIWDKAAHNAFTDLIFFKNQWYCTFREGKDHVCNQGKIRIIRSKDGKKWRSIALLKWKKGDLRDPKFSITHKNELMVNGVIRFVKPVDNKRHQSITWLSEDGKNWNEPFTCNSGLATWRWSTTWHKDKAYSFAYGGKHPRGALYSSNDGKQWDLLKEDVYPKAQAQGNETSLVFLPNDEAYCLLRRDRGSFCAMLGFSTPPYTQWKWTDLKRYIGGPKMIPLKKRFLVGGRLFRNKQLYTALCWVNPEKGSVRQALRLPSSGDSSYPGLVHHNNEVWMSYYSSHEGKTAIYFAKVKV
jgi:hypothetical protein